MNRLFSACVKVIPAAEGALQAICASQRQPRSWGCKPSPGEKANASKLRASRTKHDQDRYKPIRSDRHRVPVLWIRISLRLNRNGYIHSFIATGMRACARDSIPEKCCVRYFNLSFDFVPTNSSTHSEKAITQLKFESHGRCAKIQPHVSALPDDISLYRKPETLSCRADISISCTAAADNRFGSLYSTRYSTLPYSSQYPR